MGLVTVVLLVTGLMVGTLAKAQAATKPVTVSLTFDDSNADQLPAEQEMHSLGLDGTFYTVSGWVNQPGYLTLAQVQQIAADGNEIAGHTIEHPDLPTLALAEQEREICNDRVNLINWGFQPTDFAYPFADADTNEAYAKACGYNSARGLGDVVDPEGDCSGCVYAETTPPPDPYYLRAPDEVESTWTLANMEAEVTNAEAHSGGWVILTYHHICSDIGAADCPADLSTTPTIFNAFVTWLAAQKAKGVTVKTVQQVIGGKFNPGVSVNPPAPAAAGVNALVDPSLTSTDANTGFPSCYQPGGWGTNTVAWASTTNVPPGSPAGSKSENVTLTNYSSGDAKLLPTMDQGACTPTVVPGNVLPDQRPVRGYGGQPVRPVLPDHQRQLGLLDVESVVRCRVDLDDRHVHHACGASWGERGELRAGPDRERHPDDRQLQLHAPGRGRPGCCAPDQAGRWHADQQGSAARSFPPQAAHSQAQDRAALRDAGMAWHARQVAT